MGTILIIEDDLPTVSLLEAVFQGGPHTVKAAANFQEFRDLLEGLETPLVALVDEQFPGGNGTQVAQMLREKIPEAKLISTSADEDRFITWGPDARFRKPLAIKDLLPRVAELMEQQEV